MRSPDPVKAAIQRADRLLDGSPQHVEVGELTAELEALSPRELLRFDGQSRSLHSGLSSKAIAQLRWPLSRGARRSLWEVLGLVSGDGHERERAIGKTTLSPLTARLLAIRAIDWVDPVRDAALERLDGCPLPLLVEAMPLADQVVAERIRGRGLGLLLDRRLSDDALREAARAPGARIRRAAWRRIVTGGAARAEQVVEAAGDPDAVVRLLAASAIGRLEPEERRRPALILVGDPVGAVAARALDPLVALDGAAAVRSALTGRSAGVRRAARGWAAVRGIDARAVYLERLDADQRDVLALSALAELGDARDAEVFRAMLDDDRVRVRAAGLRALARVDRPAARQVAVEALRSGASGRLLWAATDVLRATSPSGVEIAALVPIALDAGRPSAQRFRALSLLRPSRWVHLATLLQARDDAELRPELDHELDTWIVRSGRIGRSPAPEVRREIEERLPALDRERRRQIEFVLRTSV